MNTTPVYLFLPANPCEAQEHPLDSWECMRVVHVVDVDCKGHGAQLSRTLIVTVVYPSCPAGMARVCACFLWIILP
jgi:hypothetical protein